MSCRDGSKWLRACQKSEVTSTSVLPSNHRNRTIVLPRFLREKLHHHSTNYCAAEADAIAFTAPNGAPMRNSNVATNVEAGRRGDRPSRRAPDTGSEAHGRGHPHLRGGSSGGDQALSRSLLDHGDDGDIYGHLFPSEQEAGHCSRRRLHAISDGQETDKPGQTLVFARKRSGRKPQGIHEFRGGPRGTRTHNQRVKSPVLCQLS